MKILISPAKQMKHSDIDFFEGTQPLFLEEAHFLVQELRSKSLDTFQSIMHCSTAIAQKAYHLYQTFDQQERSLALFSYKGIQYQYMAPDVLEDLALAYLQKHLMILSGLYGLLRPFDWIAPYRLEMQARLSVDGARDLYAFWGDTLYEALAAEGCDLIVNVASVEYARAVTPFVRPDGPQVLTCLFGVLRDGRLRQPATEAKAARGTFIRWCAERGVTEPNELRSFAERGYSLDEARSDEATLVFVRGER